MTQNEIVKSANDHDAWPWFYFAARHLLFVVFRTSGRKSAGSAAGVNDVSIAYRSPIATNFFFGGMPSFDIDFWWRGLFPVRSWSSGRKKKEENVGNCQLFGTKMAADVQDPLHVHSFIIIMNNHNKDMSCSRIIWLTSNRSLYFMS